MDLSYMQNHKYTIMKTKNKELYKSPATSVVELKTQGIICVSGNVNATMETEWEEIPV